MLTLLLVCLSSFLLTFSLLKLIAYIRAHIRLYYDVIDFPGPPIGNPLIGHLGLFLHIAIKYPMKDYGTELNKLMNNLASEYDPSNTGLIRLWFGPFMPWIIVYDAASANAILYHPEYLAKARFYQPLLMVAGQELLNLSGKAFLTEKKKFIKFFKLPALEEYIKQISTHLDVFERKIHSPEKPTHFSDAEPLISTLVFDCVGHSFFNIQFNSQKVGLPNAVTRIHKLVDLMGLFLLTPWNYFLGQFHLVQLLFNAPTGIFGLHHLLILRRFIDKSINLRRSSLFSNQIQPTPSPTKSTNCPLPMLDSMILSQTTRTSETVDNIPAHITTFLTASHDATTTTLSWLLYLLAHHPTEQSKCREEIMQHFDGTPTETTPTLSTLKSLKYLEATIKECLRLYAPGPFFGRRGRVHLPLASGHTLPPNVNLVIFIERMHHRGDYFASPRAFKPERFFTNTEVTLSAFMPFSHGPTACIGKEYGFLIIKLFLVRILASYQISAHDSFGDIGPACTFFEQGAHFPISFTPISAN